MPLENLRPPSTPDSLRRHYGNPTYGSRAAEQDLNKRPPGPEISVQNPYFVDSVSHRGRATSSHSRIVHPMLHPAGVLLAQPLLSSIERLPVTREVAGSGLVARSYLPFLLRSWFADPYHVAPRNIQRIFVWDDFDNLSASQSESPMSLNPSGELSTMRQGSLFGIRSRLTTRLAPFFWTIRFDRRFL